MLRKLTIVFCLFCSISFLQAQENTPPSDWEFTPSIKFDGMFKSKYEYSDQVKVSRFSVRNSRLGIKGDVTSFISYRAMAELSDQGKFNVLDLYSAINPYDGLTIKIGQSSIPVHNSYTTSPGSVMFANRPFIGKYFTYGTRDIGVSAAYNFKISDFPIGIDAAIFNGNTINDPVWTDKPSYAARLRIGNMKGFRTTAKMYKLPKNELEDYMIYGADLRYESNNWKIETEVMHRKNKVKSEKLASAYLQGAYWFPIQNSQLFKNMIAAARWDAMGSNQTDNDIDVNRLTLGLGFSFTKMPFDSLMRIDYEFYNAKNRKDLGIFTNDVMDSNKLSIELLLTF